MGLFGAGALRRKLEAKTTEFDGLVAELRDLQSKFKKMEEQLASKDEQFRIAREGRQKADKKVEKLTQKCATHDHKLSDLTKSLEKASAARDEYRREMARLSSELERTRASIAQTGAPVAPEVASTTHENDKEAKVPAEPVVTQQFDERKLVRRVAVLEEKLETEKTMKDELKARALKAEQSLREESRKRASNSGKQDARVRELEHALQSERKAYKILQLQFEAKLEESRGAAQNATGNHDTASSESA